MKKLIAIALIVSVSILATQAQDVQENLRQTANKVIEAFQKHDYKTFVSYFDDTMKKSMTEEQVSSISKCNFLKKWKSKIYDNNDGLLKREITFGKYFTKSYSRFNKLCN